ncbi:MAG: ActS/PrrB/RegB family redox-sensitive histidine kinase [Paracoccaceae bacterium]|nr:ActS/PrrB/RegB family redox-sensitive histidine kinase [Paracoccaceae bacterium]
MIPDRAMSAQQINALDTDRSNWLRLRTFITLRWIAIAGQLAAITLAMAHFRLQLDLGLCLLVIGISVMFNLIATMVFPESKRLSETQALWMLIFDVLQLSMLLFLTGGLHNPFALLVLAPVTIAATTLRTAATVLTSAVAVACISLLVRFNLPLRTELGFTMRMPEIYLFGFWAALVIGTIFVSVYARRVSSEAGSMSEALLAAQLALSREQKITDLAGVVAATAHELGTPLATIKLAATELAEELEDHPELREDAALIRSQADRCRDILRSMGRAGKEDRHLQYAPLIAILREAAEPHENRGKTIVFEAEPGEGTVVLRRPEIVHGLRNLIQNGVDFAQSTVWIELLETDAEVTVRIIDDGRGFAQQVLGRIGDPFVRRRSDPQPERPGYEGMGLGLFIAKTLLERSGAELFFANGRDLYEPRPRPGEKKGAIVEVVWPLKLISPDPDAQRRALGENPPIET